VSHHTAGVSFADIFSQLPTPRGSKPYPSFSRFPASAGLTDSCSFNKLTYLDPYFLIGMCHRETIDAHQSTGACSLFADPTSAALQQYQSFLPGAAAETIKESIRLG